MKFTPLHLAIVAVTSLTGCGGGSSTGDTLPSSSSAEQKNYTACLDSNANWQCDDNDIVVGLDITGETGLSPDTLEHVLIEAYDDTNQRNLLLISEAGGSEVTGQSTLLAVLAANDALTTDLQTTISAYQNSDIETQIQTALTAYPIALAGLAAYANAVVVQGNSIVTLPEFVPAINTAETLASWDSTESTDTRRQLTSQGSLVLNTSDTNRLYLFDASAETINSTSIDLIPLDQETLATTTSWLRTGLAWVHEILDFTVDGVTAATAISGEISEGGVVVLDPGQGVTDIQIINAGQEAIVAMNMLDATYTGDTCVDGSNAVSEGIFRVPLDSSSYTLLNAVPACIHSGFSLLTSDAAGQNILAWDTTSESIWLLTGTDMTLQKQIDLNLSSSTPPQAIALTPGGQYAAVVAAGHAIFIDVNAGTVLHTLEGSWGSVTGAVFAEGGRALVISGETSLFIKTLDDALQPLSESTVALTDGNTPLRAITLGDGGDSVITTTDSEAIWLSILGTELARTSLDSSLTVQQASLAHNELILLGRNAQTLAFTLQRLPLSIPEILPASLRTE